MFEGPFERSSGRDKLRSQAEAKLRAVNGALRLRAERAFQPGRDSKECFDRSQHERHSSGKQPQAPEIFLTPRHSVENAS